MDSRAGNRAEHTVAEDEGGDTDKGKPGQTVVGEAGTGKGRQQVHVHHFGTDSDVL